ncbi:MAG TPA: hypothetical protein VFL67_11295 [Mycobacterium sp.]|nr:hypothetical protein [Mycobacterium sp.]
MRPTHLLVALAAAVLLTSCGAAAEPAQSPSPSAPATSNGHGGYAECLAEHGISTPPAGPAAPPGVDPQTWVDAQRACAGKAPGPAS